MKQNAELLKKIIPIEADYNAHDLGINKSDLQKIQTEVQVRPFYRLNSTLIN